MEARIWGDPSKAKVLAIGHDPRLQKTDTVAGYCFFADYYFRPKPTRTSERAKYELAAALFDCVRDLTNNRYTDNQLLVTNLCNKALPHAPEGKTVLIPQKEAVSGLQTIRSALFGSNVEVILAMSQQVNYWLQKLEFYPPISSFLTLAEPTQRGINNDPPYYEPSKPGAFQLICGNRYIADGKFALFPIVHVKQWPLKGNFLRAYGKAYENLRNYF